MDIPDPRRQSILERIDWSEMFWRAVAFALGFTLHWMM